MGALDGGRLTFTLTGCGGLFIVAATAPGGNMPGLAPAAAVSLAISSLEATRACCNLSFSVVRNSTLACS